MACNGAKSETETLDNCGCCESDLPEYHIYNRPGQPQVAFRLATHANFQRRMLSQLSRWTVPDGDHAKEQPLSRLTTRDEDDPAIAFLDAWATVADVLTFYQERIANEAWLRTATERRSVLELARSIGYELNPGVAASTWLTFSVDESDSTPEETTVRAGTQVQSIPMQEDELPQTFETGEDFIAHAGWNRLLPRLTEEQIIQKTTRRIFFTGVKNNLKAGDRLLLIGTAKNADYKSDDWDMRRVLAVESEAEKLRTRVEVTEGLRELGGDFDILVMRQRASIFGHNAPDWNGLSKQVRSDYLNLDSIYDLVDFDTGEWPRFTICAPGNTLGDLLTIDRPLEVTARQVADAAMAAADIQAKALTEHAFSTVPTMLLSGASAVKHIALAVGEASSKLVDFPAGILETTNSSLETIFQALTDVVGAIGLQLPSFSQFTYEPPDLSNDPPDPLDPIHTFNRILVYTATLMQEISNSAPTLSIDNALVIEKLTVVFTELVQLLSEFNPLKVFEALYLQLGRAEVVDDYSALSMDVVQGFNSAIESLKRSADAASSAAAASALSQLLHSVIETEMLLDPAPEQVATVARFTTKIARYGALLHSPQTLFANVDISELKLTEVSETLDKLDSNLSVELLKQLPADLQNLEREDQLALVAVIGISAFGAGGAVAAIGGAAGLPVAAAALGPGLLPLVLMGPSVYDGVAQIGDAVELAIEHALAQTTETVISYRPVYLSSTCRVDLDSRYDSIGPDSWAYLEAGGNKALFRITHASSESRAEYLISGEVSRLTLAGPSLDPFKARVRQTKVYANGNKLELAQIDMDLPVAGLQVDLEKPLEPLPQKDAWLIVQGIAANGEENTELVSVASASPMQLRFESGLKNSYQRQTVQMYLNAVPATHGETVADEVLGSGDGARSFQRFKLRKPPLTFVSSAAPSGADSSLSIRVDGVKWRQMPSLYGLHPTDRAYILRRSDDGDTYIQFGDGATGARLPTGQENVTASYRSGIGFDGEVTAGSLTLLKKRPFGIKDVSNPLPASAADEPEKLEDARQNAPLTVLTLERIVSLQDFEDFARAYAGIGKARALPLWYGEQELVHISIASASGDEIADTSTLFRNLLAAIDQARDPLREVMLASFERRSFELDVRVLRNAAYRWEDIQVATQSALLKAFSFAKRRFGQPVTSAEIIEEIHAIDGVDALDIDKLYLLNAAGQQQGKDFSSVLPVASARTVNGGFLPTELLLINPSGITLTEMTSR